LLHANITQKSISDLQLLGELRKHKTGKSWQMEDPIASYLSGNLTIIPQQRLAASGSECTRHQSSEDVMMSRVGDTNLLLGI